MFISLLYRTFHISDKMDIFFLYFYDRLHCTEIRLYSLIFFNEKNNNFLKFVLGLFTYISIYYYILNKFHLDLFNSIYKVVISVCLFVCHGVCLFVRS